MSYLNGIVCVVVYVCVYRYTYVIYAYVYMHICTYILYKQNADTRNKALSLVERLHIHTYIHAYTHIHTYILYTQNADTRNKALSLVERLFKAYGHKVDSFLKGVESEATRKMVKDK